MKESVLFTGRAHPALAALIAKEAHLRLGPCEIEPFPDGELSVRLLEPVRRREVFIIQPISPPVNEHLVELLIFADACRRAAADRITAVIPYFGYARSDKRHGRRESITASMVAHLLEAVSIDHVVSIDLHTPQIEGFFHTPVDSLTAVPTLCLVLRELLPSGVVVVSPDAGRVAMATEYAQRLGGSVIVLHKHRESGTETEVTHVVGDVRDKTCLVVDDMISTGGTIAQSVDVLLKAGARPDLTVAATHGLLFAGGPRAVIPPSDQKCVCHRHDRARLHRLAETPDRIGRAAGRSSAPAIPGGWLSGRPVLALSRTPIPPTMDRGNTLVPLAWC